MTDVPCNCEQALTLEYERGRLTAEIDRLAAELAATAVAHSNWENTMLDERSRLLHRLALADRHVCVVDDDIAELRRDLREGGGWEQGAKAERAAVVAWLRAGDTRWMTDGNGWAEAFADAIEAGAHVGTLKKAGGPTCRT